MLVTCLLTGETFGTCSRAVSNALWVRTKASSVDGSLSKPSPTSPDSAAWGKCNSMVISWIFNSLRKELHDSVAYADYVRHVNVLQDRFLHGNAPRVHQLSLLQQEGLSIAAYYPTFKLLCAKLGAFSSVPICRVHSWIGEGRNASIFNGSWWCI